MRIVLGFADSLSNLLAVVQTSIGGRPVRIGGIAKGSGMIHPNMATMLGVVTTDAAVAPSLWRGILQHGVAKSFNQVSICHVNKPKLPSIQ